MIFEIQIKEIKHFIIVDIEHDDSVGDNNGLKKSFILQSNEKTFTEEEINTIMDSILKKLKTSLGLELR